AVATVRSLSSGKVNTVLTVITKTTHLVSIKKYTIHAE
ncbi:MAG: hypothetical protein ACI9IT_002159, partial [Glaciecola sp.]